MNITDWETEETLVTPPVDRLFEKYLNKLQLSPKEFWTKFSVARIKRVLLLAICDFLNKEISLDEFSSVANSLCYNGKYWSLFEFNGYNELQKALEEGSELSWYNWKKYWDADSSIKIIKEYYNTNKEYISDLV